MKKERIQENQTVIKRIRLNLKDMEDFTRVTNALFDQGRSLTTSAKWVHASLMSFGFESNGYKIFPGYEIIIKKSGLTRATVAKALSELKRFGYLEIDKSQGSSNHYKLSYPSIQTNTGQVIRNQAYPTKEMAKSWRAEKKSKVK